MDKFFHYYAKEDAIAALWDSQIKVSSPCDMNDPMEFLPSVNRTDSVSACESFRDLSKNQVYILSMTTRNDNSRMWSQYGGNHTGIMITFDFSKGSLISHYDEVFPVQYHREKRPKVEKLLTPRFDEISKLLLRKGKDWEHEEEVRLLLANGEKEKTGLQFGILNGQVCCFLPFTHDSVSSVTLGYRSSQALSDSLFKVREERKAKWRIFKARLHDNEYKLVNYDLESD
jgi:Protein of unknown function (DUF2971)